MSDARRLILGSSSIYRKELLERFGVPFQCLSPDIDETPHTGEAPDALVRRLSESKAQAVAAQVVKAIVIGSDEVPILDGQILGKPGTHEGAVQQLRASSGKSVTFITGLCVLDTESGERQIDCVSVEVGFKHLDDPTIEAYLQRDKPYACAGSIRAEGAGSAILRYIKTDDPSALIGLPLIRLSDMLYTLGFDVLATKAD